MKGGRITGFTILAEGVHPNDAKIKALVEFLTPTDSTSVKRFLGMLNFYRRHVHDLAAVARPLTTLTCKDMATGGNVPFNRSSYCKEAFTELKQRSIATPVLQTPDLTRPIFVKTDVTIVRFGDVLEQLLTRAEPVKPYWICKSADKPYREKVCPNRIGGMCLNSCSEIL